MLLLMNTFRTAKSNAKKNGSFQKMGLSKAILSGVLRMGYKLPTPIQKASIPIALTGKDVVAMARTGSSLVFFYSLCR